MFTAPLLTDLLSRSGFPHYSAHTGVRRTSWDSETACSPLERAHTTAKSFKYKYSESYYIYHTCFWDYSTKKKKIGGKIVGCAPNNMDDLIFIRDYRRCFVFSRMRVNSPFFDILFSSCLTMNLCFRDDIVFDVANSFFNICNLLHIVMFEYCYCLLGSRVDTVVKCIALNETSRPPRAF